MRALAVVALVAGGCVTHVSQQCPSCPIISAQSSARRVPAGARRFFVLVPGALGYGWEWDEAVAALREARVPFVVFWWNPWGSLARGAGELKHALEDLLFTAPPSLAEIVVVAHSAAGMIGAHAVGELRVPDGRHVKLVTIGTPFAGMGVSPFTMSQDPLRTPAVIAVGGVFTGYPPPAPGVEIIEYVTSFPPDPVMEPRFGHHPAGAEIAPRPANRIPVDPKLDHNHVVAFVVREQLAAR